MDSPDSFVAPASVAVTPRFSVVIPTCRRNASLASCLDRLGAEAQKLAADTYEVIVADDGPETDNARSMVRDTYPWARWVAGPRRGPAANRNRGASEARGTWLVFTDDDCLPELGWLAAYAERLDEEDGGSWRVLEGRTTPGDAKDYGPFLTAPVNDKGGLLWSCNFAIERNLFMEIGGFDERIPYPHLEDVDLRMRLEDGGHGFPFVSSAVVAHPPRPAHPVRKWVAAQESAFYLARKRGVPVSQLGQSVMTHLRMWVLTMRACRNVKEKILATWGSVTGLCLVACHWPVWSSRYGKPSTAGGSAVDRQ